MTEGFRIPAGRDARGRLVSPAEATKRAQYMCPACSGRIDLHAGEKKRRHFHHRAGACSSETVVHLSAKRLVVQAVEDWLAGGEPPVFLRTCAHGSCEATTRQAMPRKVGRAIEEHRLASGHVADVALLARVADVPVAVIEVLHTHAVDDAKAFELGVPWIEVDAAQVCEDGGRLLVAVRDRLLPWLCAEHASSRGEPQKRARADRERLGLVLRRLDYRLADFPRYRVERVATCPSGHDAVVFAWEGASPPDPRPPHVVAVERTLDPTYRPATKGWKKLLPYRRAFASVCPTCGQRLDAQKMPPTPTSTPSSS